MSERFYLTTAIFYPSERPALHSMFEAIGADAIARYQRLLGRETRFLTGFDEHSANVERDARDLGIDPHDLIDPWAATWKATFERFVISADRFIRTTDPDHAVASTEMVRRAQANGDVYEGLYSGWFCTGCNEFKTDQQLVDGRCPDHPTLEPQWLEEHNYFFRLSAYQERLERLYADNPSFCEPEHFRNEVLGWLREGLRDFSISRSGTTWGIPFPGNESHRIYVWFDALTNYLTGAGFPNDEAAMDRWWPADLHVIGKNITRFHCLYWPAMLMSAGLPLPRQVFAHGFMFDVSGQRMSKTTGNTEDPDEMADRFGVDGVRYAVLAEVPFDRDANVTLDGFVRRYNADLANDLGNLVNRTISMSARYLDGHLPAVADATRPADDELRETAAGTVERYHAAMERHHLDEALAAVMGLAGAANGYAEGQAPWSLSKAGETERVGQVLAMMAEVCRILGHLLAPVAPAGARAILEQLGLPPPYDDRGAGGPGLDVLLAWGGGAASSGPTTTGAASPIFPRIEAEALA
jgi:methionyl-tRNA synthetase